MNKRIIIIAAGALSGVLGAGAGVYFLKRDLIPGVAAPEGAAGHAVIMYLTERKIDELIDPAGKEKLRQSLHEQINEAIGEKMVSNVYFKEFLIQ